jgi:thioredoxin-like negative regulator of GroEL
MHDSVGIVQSADVRSVLYGRIARQFSSIGLQEESIDYTLRALADGADDPQLSLFLADLYVAKKRPSPARRILLSLLERHPDVAEAKARLENPYLQP